MTFSEILKARCARAEYRLRGLFLDAMEARNRAARGDTGDSLIAAFLLANCIAAWWLAAYLWGIR